MGFFLVGLSVFELDFSKRIVEHADITTLYDYLPTIKIKVLFNI